MHGCSKLCSHRQGHAHWSNLAGKVMSNLQPDQAARIGELLARRKASEKAAKVASQAAAAGAQPPPESELEPGKGQRRPGQ